MLWKTCFLLKTMLKDCWKVEKIGGKVAKNAIYTSLIIPSLLFLFLFLFLYLYLYMGYGHFPILNYGICRVFCKSGGLKKEKHHHNFKWKRVNIKARQRGFARGFYIISVSPSVICCKANINDYKSGMFLIK